MSTKVIDRTRTRFEEGSGNVFADVGIANPDEALAKADLADAIARELQDRGSTQARSAEILGIDQGSVSKLVNGRLDGFSQERLIRYLNILGMDVDILVRPTGSSSRRGRLTVALG